MAVLDGDEFWTAAAEAFANHTLELTLLPTEQCNLRCVYCYEKFERARMEDWVVSAVKALLVSRGPELTSLVLDWFGGEPLLALDVIEDIGALAQRMADDNPRLDYRSSVTTNGVFLTAECARRLASVGVRHLHVSLDGPAEVHDRTRRLAGGQGTFARIERNLLDIRSSDVETEIDLRVHVTPANIDYLDAFTDMLADSFLADDRFSVYFFPIVDLGGPNQGAFRVLTARDAADMVRRLTAKVAAVQNGRRKRRKGCDSAYVCYAAKPNAWVVRSDGRLGKCTVGLDDAQNDVGVLRPDGSFDLKTDRVRPWLRGWSNGDLLSLHCPYEEMREDVSRGLVVSRR